MKKKELEELVSHLVESINEIPDMSAKIKAGIAFAKAQGAVMGAPKGEKRRLGKFKEHDEKLVSRIIYLNAQNATLRHISKTTGLSISTVSRILKRYR